MSAYLVSTEDYQTVSNFMFWVVERKDMSFAHSTRTFLELDYDCTEEQIKEAVALQVRNLYNLNRLALVSRYGDTYDRNDKASFEPKITYNTPGDATVVEILQSIRYQCGEYLTDNTKLYGELDLLIGRYCESLVSQYKEQEAHATEEYQAQVRAYTD